MVSSYGIIGNGDIAKVLPTDTNLLFFASGVSNSQCSDEDEYRRELSLLLEQPKTAHIIYFSSLAIFYSDTRYTQHKRFMEAKIKANFDRYTIVRIGNITWGKNPNTLINYLREHPQAKLKDEYRYLIDKEEFLHWINLIPDFSCEICITGKRMKVREIYDAYVVPYINEIYPYDR